MSSPCHVKCIPKPLPRDPVPNHYDQASTNPRKLKYVDPSHRNCVPGFAAASFTPKDPAEKYRGRTHNCTAAVTANSGERYAVTSLNPLHGCVGKQCNCIILSTAARTCCRCLLRTPRAGLASSFLSFWTAPDLWHIDSVIRNLTVWNVTGL